MYRRPPRKPEIKVTRVATALAILAFVGAGVVSAVRRPASAGPDHEEARSSRTGAAAAADATKAKPAGRTPRLRLGKMALAGQRFEAPLFDGGRAELTLSPAMQAMADEVLAKYPIPFAAAAVVSVPDGQVLVLSGKSLAAPELGPADLALRPWAPAASIFKLVSAAALLERKGVGAKTKVCYHGGLRGIQKEHLVDNPRLDRDCDSLAYGVAKSQNSILAKLAHRYLDRERLGRAAAAFGFGAEIPFAGEFYPSDAFMPSDDLELARAAAGFWHSSLSVLHGALIAAAIGNEGRMPLPRIIAAAHDRQGRARLLAAGGESADPKPRPTISPAVARAIGEMMVETTTKGTARSHFFDRRGRRYLPVEVAGKTGSLDYRGEAGDPAPPAPWPERGYLHYNWFVGYAPATKPEVAFAVVLGNPAKWHIKAPYVARRLIEAYLAEKAASPEPELVAEAAADSAAGPASTEAAAGATSASAGQAPANAPGLPGQWRGAEGPDPAPRADHAAR